ncbi:MAG: holin [Clostridiales bacterium]|jgi:uncharacterized membrane protein|nr:holin [Clostridiales bacterium]
MKIDASRFKNYGFWVSLFALIPMVLNAMGMEIIPEQYETITTAILTILVALGIVSNPTTECKWYKDDTNKITEEKNNRG